MRPLAEQTILVTGATDGLGRALAADLAASGAQILVHGRDERRGQDTLDEIRARTPGARVRFLRADLAALAEVRDLAARVERETGRLDVLVNNAGIGATTGGEERREESRDGHELRFAVNYLSGYLLTRLLLPLLERSAPARVVNVSSAGQTPIDFDDVMITRGYRGGRAYCQSKLAQVMFTFDLASELDGRGVTATCLHPATYMPTKMVIEAGTTPANPLERGLEATRRLVADPELDGVTGVYFDGVRRAEPDPQAYDAGARLRLRALSDELCGLA
jgi:NAD(P)-dependent dehydrogenase (short-subunit alcohol dehydrogenase family)